MQQLSVALIAAALLAASCGRRKPVSLEVDFTARELWPYRLAAVVGGSARLPDSALSFADTLEARLSGRATGDPQTLRVTAHGVGLRSSAMDPVEIVAVRERLEGAELTVSLREGFVAMDSAAGRAPLRAGKWDLYRHLVRMLPVLPKPKARPGFTWDREARLPLHTHHGPASARLYQAFSFDSVHNTPDGSRLAHLSWQFRYTLDPSDTTGHLDRLPGKGTGSGSAVIDLDGRVLRRAAARLTVPPSENDPLGIAWHEEAEMILDAPDGPEEQQL